jgi:hypothetical protein
MKTVKMPEHHVVIPLTSRQTLPPTHKPALEARRVARDVVQARIVDSVEEMSDQYLYAAILAEVCLTLQS